MTSITVATHVNQILQTYTIAVDSQRTFALPTYTTQPPDCYGVKSFSVVKDDQSDVSAIATIDFANQLLVIETSDTSLDLQTIVFDVVATMEDPLASLTPVSKLTVYFSDGCHSTIITSKVLQNMEFRVRQLESATQTFTYFSD